VKIELNQLGVSIFNAWIILGLLILIPMISGCIGRDKGPVDSSGQNASEENLNNHSNINESKPNLIRLRISDSKDFNATGKLNLTINITNPIINETVFATFVPEVGSGVKYRVNLTHAPDKYWTQKFAMEMSKNNTYFQVLIDIAQNNNTIKKSECKIQIYDLNTSKCKVTFEAPVGQAK